MRHRLAARVLAFVGLMLHASCALAAGAEPAIPSEPRPFLVSGAGQELMIQLWNDGHYRDHAVVRAVVER